MGDDVDDAQSSVQFQQQHFEVRINSDEYTETLTTARHCLLLLLVAERAMGYVVRVCRKSDTKNVPVLYRGGRYNEPLTTRYNQSDGFSFFFLPLSKKRRRRWREVEGNKPSTPDLSPVGDGGGLAKKKGVGSIQSLLALACIFYTHKVNTTHTKKSV